ncbi:MAG: response regulator [Chitinophagaceae bacterium]
MGTVHILLVEDNEGDILLTQEAMEAATMLVKISVVNDGQEAIEFLTRQNGFAKVQVPDLILLDINLPRKNGHEVLKFIKGDTGLKQIPVIMLTTSSSEKEINLAYQNYVNCYITKPVEVNEFISIVKTIENFWISVAKLPKTKNY